MPFNHYYMYGNGSSRPRNPHYDWMVRDCVNENFSGRNIGEPSKIEWCPRSDFSLNFLLYRHMQNTVSCTLHTTKCVLRKQIMHVAKWSMKYCIEVGEEKLLRLDRFSKNEAAFYKNSESLFGDLSVPFFFKKMGKMTPPSRRLKFRLLFLPQKRFLPKNDVFLVSAKLFFIIKIYVFDGLYFCS